VPAAAGAKQAIRIARRARWRRTLSRRAKECAAASPCQGEAPAKPHRVVELFTKCINSRDGLQLLQTIWLLTTCFVCAPNLINGHCEFAKQVDDLFVPSAKMSE